MNFIKRHTKMTQKIFMALITVMLLFNFVFPTAVHAANFLEWIGQGLLQMLLNAAMAFVRFIADSVEGFFQYYFIRWY